MNVNKTFVLQMASAQMQVAGTMLQAQDVDSVGTDDVIGKVLNSGGKAVGALGQGDIQTVDESLRLVADSIYDYLGLEQPQPKPVPDPIDPPSR